MQLQLCSIVLIKQVVVVALVFMWVRFWEWDYVSGRDLGLVSVGRAAAKANCFGGLRLLHAGARVA